MRKYEPDFRPLTEQELREIDKKTNEEMKKVNYTDWAIKLLTVGMLWAMYERLGKPIPKTLAPMVHARITRDHVYGRRRPGGILGSVENIRDVIPYNRVARNTLKSALLNGAENIQKMSDQARATLKILLVRSKMEGTHPKQLAVRMREAMKGLDRDWRKIAVTESASLATNGYLMSQGEGQLVIGQSAVNACDWCKDSLHGKIFTMTHKPPEKAVDKAWETHVWPGKTNVGKTRHPRARSGRNRSFGELWKPTIPLHPACRCRWVAFNPKFHEVDSEGFVKVRT